jgi:hypothetical protein
MRRRVLLISIERESLIILRHVNVCLHTPLQFILPSLQNIVAYGPIAKKWLGKQRPLLGNIRNIHASNNRKTGSCNPFLSKGSVNTPTSIEILLETVFCIRSVQSGYKEEFSWEWTVEFRSSEWAVGGELESRVQVGSVNQRTTEAEESPWIEAVFRKRLVETVIDWGQ